MNRKKKNLLITAGILAAAGAISTGAGLAAGGSIRYSIDLQNGYQDLEVQEKREDRRITLEADFDRIDLELEAADIRVCRTEEAVPFIETNLSEKEIKVSGEEGVLTIQEPKKKYLYLTGFGINFGKGYDQQERRLDLYLPEGQEPESVSLKGEYGDLEITQVNCDTLDARMESGNIFINDVKADTAAVYAEYGNIDWHRGDAGSTELHLESGDLSLQDIRLGVFEADSEYGNVELKECKMDTGTIKMESGDADVSKTTVGSGLKIDCEYGNITMSTGGKADTYSYSLEAEDGEIRVEGESASGKVSREKDGAPMLRFTAEAGDITLN